MNNWIDNPISHKITYTTSNNLSYKILNKRVYRILVYRGIEVLILYNNKKVFNYLYYDPILNIFKCSKNPLLKSKCTIYKSLNIKDIISIYILNKTTIYIIFLKQTLLLNVDTFDCAIILKMFFESLKKTNLHKQFEIC